MKCTNLKQTFESNCDSSFVKRARQAAHDIRSPLTALNMIVATLEHVPSDRRELMMEAVKRIRQIAEDLLEETRPVQPPTHQDGVANQVKLKIQRHDLNQLIHETIKLKRAEYQGLPAMLIEDYIPSQEYQALVDASELKRVLSNLINNSIQAGSTAVRITLSRQTSGSDGENSILISVSDDGSGIPRTILEHLQQGEVVKYRRGPCGHGLGLSHARTMIETMGGYLMIASKRGKGTMVAIQFPELGLT